ncbi:MAG TPA: hypothetical protein VFZ28_06030, partial [Burkholderiaceae bacterium]|nr:hypothetical protein [Burkholderiaceae bacterium]
MARRKVLIGGATVAAGAALTLDSPRIFAAGPEKEIALATSARARESSACSTRAIRTCCPWF